MTSQTKNIGNISSESLVLRKRIADLESSLDKEALRSEEALLQSEKKARELVKQAPCGIYEIDFHDMKLVYVNDAVCEISGYGHEELLSMNPFDLMDKSSKQILQTRAQLWLSGEKPDGNVDYVMKTKDGRSIYTTLQVNFTLDHKNQPRGSLGIIHDFTERKAAEKIINHQNLLLSGINSIFQEALYCRSEEELGNTCLKVAQELTQSKSGFINLVSEAGNFDFVAISNPGWQDKIKNSDRYRGALPDGFDIHGIRGRVINDCESIFTNDLPHHPNFSGLPAGHPPINSFLGTPLIRGDKVIGIIGLGNKEKGYGKEDVETIEILSHAIVQALTSKKSEFALRESEERYRRLFEAMDEGFSLCELVRNDQNQIIDYRVIEANPAFEKHTGISPAQVIGCLWNQANHAGDEFLLRTCGQVVDTGESIRIDQYYYEGLRRWFSIGLFPYGGDRFGVIFKDISKRVIMNQELKESEKLYRTIFNNSEDGFVLAEVIYDEQGAPVDFTVHKVNAAFEAQTGRKGDDIVGKRAQEIAVNVKPQWNRIVDNVIKTGQPVHIESYNEQRDRWFYSHFFRYADNMYGQLFRDITAKKRTEAEMARLDRLNLIGEMAASIGHEIRNPMTSVRGFLQILSAKEEYTADQDLFALMIEELDRANEIITEYLNMARNKRIELKTKSLDKIVKALYPMIMSDANLREINVRLDLNQPPKPLLDEKEIRQLILNISRNGLEAMPAKGTLTIGTGLEEEAIILFIRDEGNGLAPEVQCKIGTPFLTTKENGTGLGLAVCYSIAARHNAKIDYDTGPLGTTFYIKFPLPD
jgi:PAS domain S-box-containing protein